MPKSAGAENTLWFFLSYAHGRGGTAVADPWAGRFFHDLTLALRERTGRAEPAVLGYMDQPGGTGSERREGREQAVSRCGVMIALYGPEYFVDSECHQEWEAFRSRLAPDGSSDTALVPVLWDRLWDDGPAQAALDRDELASRFGADGLRSALARNLGATYRAGLAHVVDAVLDALAKTEPRTPAPTAFAGIPQPWEDHPPTQQLCIEVLARTLGGLLPEGCDSTGYGSTPVQWSPYGGEGAPPLADLVAESARARNIHVTSVEAFRGFARSGARWPVAVPHLLLLDRWALTEPGLRKLLLAHERGPWPPRAVMVPWPRPPRLPVSREREDELQRLTLSTLDQAVGRPKPDFEQMRRGIPDEDAFRDELPTALAQARQAFLRWEISESGSAYRQRRAAGTPVVHNHEYL